MKKYIFFIGGSGARVYKAFIHGSAAGMLKTKEVSTMLVDADKSNDANTSCIDLYKAYCQMKKRVEDIGDTAFTCDIQMESEEVLSPVKSDAYNLRSAVGTINKDRERLMKAFYTEEEMKQDLRGGFYAHPNIGCVFFSDFENEEFEKCLKKIEEQLENGEEVMVALVGSVFGGTGAAGIPTLFKLINSRLKSNPNYEKLHIGGIFLEPYFRVKGKAVEQDENILINMEEFYFNTYEALSYYKTNHNMDFKSIYLLGQATLDVVNHKYASSGAGQKNKPHIIELYAALAIDRFLELPKESGIFGYVGKRNIGWDSFPKINEEEPYNNAELQLAGFVRAQAIFIGEIYSYIFSDDREWAKKCGIMIPQWYKAYGIHNEDIKRQMREISQYSFNFMEWLYAVNSKYGEDNKLVLDKRMNLFGDVLENVYYLSADLKDGKELSKKEVKANFQTFRKKFDELVDTAEHVEYVLDKVGDVLSLAGIVPGMSPALGAAGLFMKIVALARKSKKQKR